MTKKRRKKIVSNFMTEDNKKLENTKKQDADVVPIQDIKTIQDMLKKLIEQDSNFINDIKTNPLALKYLIANLAIIFKTKEEEIKKEIDNWVKEKEKEADNEEYINEVELFLEMHQEEMEKYKESEYKKYKSLVNSIEPLCQLASNERLIPGQLSIEEQPPIKEYFPTILLNINVQLGSPPENSSLHIFDGEKWLSSITPNMSENKPWKARIAVAGGPEATDRYYTSKTKALEGVMKDLIMTYFLKNLELDFVNLPEPEKEKKNAKVKEEDKKENKEKNKK